MLHAGNLRPYGLLGRVENAIPHYMWMWGSGREKSGVCSHCHAVLHGREALEYPDGGMIADVYLDAEEYDEYAHPGWYKNVNRDCVTCRPIHGQMGFCPACGALVEYRDMSRGHSALIDRIFYLHLQKSPVAENTLALIGYEVTSDWRGDLHPGMSAASIGPDLSIVPVEICVFQWGKGAWRMVREWNNDWSKGTGRFPVRTLSGWRMRKECNDCFCPFGFHFPNAAAHIPYVRHREDYAEALQDTAFAPFAEDGVYTFDGSVSRIDLLALIAKTPCLEYLNKLGLVNLCDLVLMRRGAEVLNLRGKTAARVLRISPDLWGWMKGTKRLPGVAALKIFQYAETAGLRIGREKLWDFSRFWMEKDLRAVCSFFGPTLARKAVNYLLRVKPRMLDYLDHLRAMTRLQIPAGESSVAFPRDFEEMHVRISGRVKILVDKDKQKMLDSFLPTIDDCRFVAEGLVMAPMETVQAVVEEGTRQQHCVGMYADRYAAGGCILCTLREEQKPNEPLFTVELRPDRTRVQFRGRRNQPVPGYEKRLKGFWAAFDAMQVERQRNMVLAKARGSAA